MENMISFFYLEDQWKKMNGQWKPKIIIEKKPREEYLKQKMSEMNLDDNIINGVSKGLNLQIKNVEEDIEDEQLLITEVKKDLNKIIKKEKKKKN